MTVAIFRAEQERIGAVGETVAVEGKDGVTIQTAHAVVSGKPIEKEDFYLNRFGYAI
jgi:hypothetical protein